MHPHQTFVQDPLKTMQPPQHNPNTHFRPECRARGAKEEVDPATSLWPDPPLQKNTCCQQGWCALVVKIKNATFVGCIR